MDALPKASLEAVGIEEPHEELEVLLLAVVRRRRHQQEVPREAPGQRAQLEPLGVLDLLTEEARRHAVGFVADNKVPLGRRFQFRLQLVVAGQHVEPGDQPRALGEGVAAHRGLDMLPAHDVEGQVELVRELVLPLFDQTAGRDDQAAFEAPPDQELLDQQPGHHGLAGARVVRKQETQRLAVEHRAVDRGQLVRQGLDLRGVDGDIGVEEVRETNAQRLGGQPEQPAVAVEGETAGGRHLLDPRFVLAIENPAAEPVRAFPRHLDGIGAVGAGGDDFHRTVAMDAGQPAPRYDGFKAHHIACILDPAPPRHGPSATMKSDHHSLKEFRQGRPCRNPKTLRRPGQAQAPCWVSPRRRRK